MAKAVDAVRNGRSSLREASQSYRIPIGTLSNHVKGIRCKKTSGGQLVFSAEEEEAFVQHIVTVSEWGLPFDLWDTQAMVKTYLQKSGRTVARFKNNVPSADWVRSFIKRHGDRITQRMCQNIKLSRDGVTPEVMEQYFANLKESLTVDGDFIPATHIFNYDETNVTDDPGVKQCIFRRGVKYPERVRNATKASTSLMFCGSASGAVLPPYVVYRADNLWNTWTEGGPMKARYNRSSSGWFDAFIFTDWFEYLFLPAVRNILTTCDGTDEGHSTPVVLIGDNLASHFTERVLQLSAEQNIRFVCIPKNSTHIAQPLDVAFYRPLKIAWRRTLDNWKQGCKRKSQTLSKDVFPRLLGELMETLCGQASAHGITSSDNLVSGFQSTGICPFNPDRVMTKLPRETTVAAQQPAAVVSETVVELLKDMRYGSDEPARRRKSKLNVKPGKSISADDLGQSTSCDVGSRKRKREHERKKLSVPVKQLPYHTDLAHHL